MHRTVPERVRSIMSSPELLNNLTAGHPDVGIRLVSTSYPDMRNVWARVGRHKDVEFPALFFSWAVELPANWQFMLKLPTTKPLLRTVAKIATAAENLAALLETHKREIAFSGGRVAFHRVMVRARTIRAELAGEGGEPDGWSYAAAELTAPPQPTLPDFLRALAAELRPRHAPSNLVIRPTKVKDKNAERTFMVKSLATFFNYPGAFGAPSFGVVAATVNTILDAKDDLLDANHARKLADGLF